MVKTLMGLWADMRGKVAAVLMILWILAFVQRPDVNSIVHPFLAVLLLVIFDICFGWIRRKVIFFSPSSLVSGLLVGLLLDPSGHIWTIFLASLIASSSKQFLEKSNRHIYNPAAFGVYIASLIFGEPVSWWVASWSIVPAIILAIWMGWILMRMKRVWMPVTFLAVYFISNLLFGNIETAFSLTVDGTVFLFAWIMLPEPMTAINSGRWKYGWGILVGVLVFIESFFRVSFGDPLLLALLGANLIGFFFTRLVTL